MTFQTYPIRPVITTDADLAQAYNQHPTSMTMVSACVTPDEARALIEQGAKFETVHLVDGAGRELFADASALPLVRHLNRNDEGFSVDTLHRLLRAELLEAGMG
jgi:hypothetical protein